jgi:hypothetical protein
VDVSKTEAGKPEGEMFMKKAFVFGAIALMGILAVSCPSPGSRRTTASPSPSPSVTPPAPGSVTVQLVFQGPPVSPGVVYAAWIEDAAGNNLQNLYVCNRVLDINTITGQIGSGPGLEGDGIPNWLTKKYRPNIEFTNNQNVDGVTGASTQQNKTMSVTFNFGPVTQFRVCFEIDRSTNSNSYFYDQPAYTYRSDVINLNNITTSATFPVNLYGWMANNTTGMTYGQQPRDPLAVPEFQQYVLITDFTHVDSTNDMVTSLTATITKN